MNANHARNSDDGDRNSSSGAAACDAVVIGGGILGLSTACELLDRGLTVTIFDEDFTRSAAWAAAGMLSPYAEYTQFGWLQDMLRAAHAAWPAYAAHVEERSGLRIQRNTPGTILPALTVERGEELESLTGRLRELGARCRVLTREEAEDEEPNMAPTVAGAVLLEDEGSTDPRSLLTALRAAFDRMEGRWISLPVLGLVSRQGKVVGVESAAGVVFGGVVLNAAGAFADRFLSPEDVRRFDLRPVRGQLVRLRPPSARDGIRHLIQAAGVAYLVPRSDGSVIVGSTSEEVGPFPGTTAGGVERILEGARRLVPGLSEWGFQTAWSGLRPRAGSGELFLQPDSSRKGLFHGLGLYRHGILLAPVAATRLSRMILEFLGRQG
jgi:glycine oxidase